MTSGEIWMGVATIIAVVAGPILAVWITRINDDRRAARARKFEIFRTLMRTRKMPIHVEHVGALNLVEVEFIGHLPVVAAWKDYLANLGEELPPIEQKERFDNALKKRDALLTKLIYEISRVLKFKVEQLDILEGNYVPQGWNENDWEHQLVRRGLIDVLHGKSAIVVRPQTAPPEGEGQSPYPPPPSQTAIDQ